MKKRNAKTAYSLLANKGIYANANADFHTLSSADVEKIIQAADEYGYRKPKNANGSRARYFYAYASKGVK